MEFTDHLVAFYGSCRGPGGHGQRQTGDLQHPEPGDAEKAEPRTPWSPIVSAIFSLDVAGLPRKENNFKAILHTIRHENH